MTASVLDGGHTQSPALTVYAQWAVDSPLLMPRPQPCAQVSLSHYYDLGGQNWGSPSSDQGPGDPLGEWPEVQSEDVVSLDP